LNQYFENILNRVLERLQGQSQAAIKQSLKKHLLLVFLSALIYNGSATIKLMEMKGVTKQIMIEIIGIKKHFKSMYEQKCLIIGLSHILRVEDAPDSIKDPATVSRLVTEILEVLDKVQRKEAKEASKKASKQINQTEDDSESEDSSSEEEDSEPEDTRLDNGKRSRGNSQDRSDGDMMDDEETKGEPTGFGFTNNDVNENEDDESSGDEYDNQVSTL